MNNFAAGGLLAQIRPANTSANLAFTAVLPTEITLIVLANLSASALNYSLYHDDNGGSTYDQTTALHYVVSLAARSSIHIPAEMIGGGIMMKTGGQLAIETSSANDLNASIYGVTAPARGI